MECLIMQQTCRASLSLQRHASLLSRLVSEKETVSLWCFLHAWRKANQTIKDNNCSAGGPGASKEEVQPRPVLGSPELNFFLITPLLLNNIHVLTKISWCSAMNKINLQSLFLLCLAFWNSPLRSQECAAFEKYKCKVVKGSTLHDSWKKTVISSSVVRLGADVWSERWHFTWTNKLNSLHDASFFFFLRDKDRFPLMRKCQWKKIIFNLKDLQWTQGCIVFQLRQSLPQETADMRAALVAERRLHCTDSLFLSH